MYAPSHFAESRPEALQALIREFPLATLFTQGHDGPQADHLPLLLAQDAGGSAVLRGHVARANPLWREHPAGSDVLAVFTGPQAYISPAWYASKREHGRVVPTWNYTVVHARGPLRVIEEAGWLLALVDALSARHEDDVGSAWSVADAPAEYIERLLAAIVGIEIRVDSLIGKWKLSQNQPQANRAGVVAGLRDLAVEPAAAMAALVDAPEPASLSARPR